MMKSWPALCRMRVHYGNSKWLEFVVFSEKDCDRFAAVRSEPVYAVVAIGKRSARSRRFS